MLFVDVDMYGEWGALTYDPEDPWYRLLTEVYFN